MSALKREGNQGDEFTSGRRARTSSGTLTDVMYVWIAARLCFLLRSIDAYSRYVVNHKLLQVLEGRQRSDFGYSALSVCIGSIIAARRAGR